jgi:hypothetical protein
MYIYTYEYIHTYTYGVYIYIYINTNILSPGLATGMCIKHIHTRAKQTTQQLLHFFNCSSTAHPLSFKRLSLPRSTEAHTHTSQTNHTTVATLFQLFKHGTHTFLQATFTPSICRSTYTHEPNKPQNRYYTFSTHKSFSQTT